MDKPIEIKKLGTISDVRWESDKCSFTVKASTAEEKKTLLEYLKVTNENVSRKKPNNK